MASNQTTDITYWHSIVERCGLGLEVFQLPTGWFAAVYVADIGHAVGVAIDLPTEVGAVATAVREALRDLSTSFDQQRAMRRSTPARFRIAS